MPFPKQQQQDQAREQDVSAAFNWFWHNFFPRALNPLPRHDAVLDREEAQQNGVDNERFCQWPGRSRINRLRDERNVADKSDRIQKCDQEDEVTNQSIKKRDESTKHIDLLSVRGPAPRRMTTDSCEDKPKASVTRQNRNGRILHPKR